MDLFKPIMHLFDSKAPQSPYLSYNDIKMVVWDFDCTISNINSGLISSGSLDIIADVDLFRDVCLRLHNDGKILAIASFGRDRIIRETLQGHDFPFRDDNILTPRSLGWSSRHHNGINGKITMLNILAQRYNLGPSQIVFLDDNPTNVRLTREAGYHSVLIPPVGCQGFYKGLVRGYYSGMPGEGFEGVWEQYVNSS